MALDKTIEHLKKFGMEERIILHEDSLATVHLAAKGLGKEPDQIGKTLGFRTQDGPILIVMSGEARIDNRLYKDFFHQKARMLSPEETLEVLEMPVGGVCPFGVPEGIPIYLDTSLKKYDIVYPSCGAINSAIGLTPDELETVTGATSWVSITKEPEN